MTTTSGATHRAELRAAARARVGWCSADLALLPDQERGSAALAARAVVADGYTRGQDADDPVILGVLEAIGLRAYPPGTPPSPKADPGKAPPILYNRPGQR
jgi:hypothetical protein